jgi:hypothetical protein
MLGNGGVSNCLIKIVSGGFGTLSQAEIVRLFRIGKGFLPQHLRRPVNSRRSWISSTEPFSLTLAVYPPVATVVYDEEILVVVSIPYEFASLHHQVQVRILRRNLPLLRHESVVLENIAKSSQFRLNQELVLCPSYQACVDSLISRATTVWESAFRSLIYSAKGTIEEDIK